ncbi:MAG: hypothetical protein F4056_07175 [Chloroflexi bacterium]|nr:hypothetical protein [Chloroflexota bacterium]
MSAPRTNLILLPGAPIAATRAAAVTTSPDATAAARAAGVPIHVRLGHPREGRLREQLEGLDGPVACVLLAATAQPQDLRAADVELRRHELQRGLDPGSVGLIPEIGSAAAIERLPQLLAAVDRLASVALDFETVAADLGAPDARGDAVQAPVLARVALAASATGLPWTVGALGFSPGDRARLAARAHALGAAGVYVLAESEVAGLNALFAAGS